MRRRSTSATCACWSTATTVSSACQAGWSPDARLERVFAAFIGRHRVDGTQPTASNGPRRANTARGTVGLDDHATVRGARRAVRLHQQAQGHGHRRAPGSGSGAGRHNGATASTSSTLFSNSSAIVPTRGRSWRDGRRVTLMVVPGGRRRWRRTERVIGPVAISAPIRDKTIHDDIHCPRLDSKEGVRGKRVVTAA